MQAAQYRVPQPVGLRLGLPQPVGLRLGLPQPVGLRLGHITGFHPDLNIGMRRIGTIALRDHVVHAPGSLSGGNDGLFPLEESQVNRFRTLLVVDQPPGQEVFKEVAVFLSSSFSESLCLPIIEI